MPDKKTTQETLRTPIDGSELVRLATSGANWQAPLSAIFSTLGGGGAAAPQYSIQFNNPLGTLDGDPLGLFNPATGLTIGGATASGSVVTPGAGAHAAIGNYATVDRFVYSPGDPVNAYSSDPPLISVLSINELHTSPAESAAGYETHGITVAVNFINQMESATPAFVGYLGASSTDSTSVNAIGDFIEVELNPTNYGSGSIDRMAGIVGSAVNLGGDVDDLYGILQTVRHSSNATVNKLYGIRTNVSSSKPTNSMYGIYIQGSAQGTSNVDALYGLWIDATAGEGEFYSYNLVSQDYSYSGSMASTIGGNLFQGHSAFGTHADVDANYAVLIDNNSHFNLKSVGVTSVNIFEGIIRFGTATNSSPQNGDVWFDGTNLKLRTGGVTKTITAA